MRDFTVITSPQDLLPQVVGELLAFATNPDLVDVVHGTHGREIHAHPEVAEAWFQARQQAPEAAQEPAQISAPVPEPVEAPSAVTPPVNEPVVDKPEAPIQAPAPATKSVPKKQPSA